MAAYVLRAALAIALLVGGTPLCFNSVLPEALALDHGRVVEAAMSSQAVAGPHHINRSSDAAPTADRACLVHFSDLACCPRPNKPALGHHYIVTT